MPVASENASQFSEPDKIVPPLVCVSPRQALLQMLAE
jgi:hypothetical protein